MDNGNKTYLWNRKSCNQLFIYYKSYWKHLNLHSKLKKVKIQADVVCPQCEWKGKDGSLRRHIRRKHP